MTETWESMSEYETMYCPCSPELQELCHLYNACCAPQEDSENIQYWHDDVDVVTYEAEEEQAVPVSQAEGHSFTPLLLIFGLLAIVTVQQLFFKNATVQANGAPVYAPLSVSADTISPIFTPEVQHWGSDIVRWADAAGVDPDLAATVMQVESCGDPRATSRAGATSLFQVMPFHFARGENPYDAETNARRGMNYLARSLSAAGGDARLAMAGYNGGIGVIGRSENAWPAETRRYASYATIYFDAISGKVESAALMDWYLRYGAGLCAQASQNLGIPR